MICTWSGIFRLHKLIPMTDGGGKNVAVAAVAECEMHVAVFGSRSPKEIPLAPDLIILRESDR